MSESGDAGQLIRVDIIVLAANDVTTIDTIQIDMTVEAAQLTKAEEGEMMKLTSKDNRRPRRNPKRSKNQRPKLSPRVR